MAEKKKGVQVSGLKQKGTSDLEVSPKVSGHGKAAGQVGLAGPHSLDAIRKPRSDQRVDNGQRVFGGISAPKVSEQTYDLYNTKKKE